MPTVTRRAARACLAIVPVLLAALVVGAPPGHADDPTTLVVLGDSYSSGEGLYPYDVGSDEPGQNLCHRSDRSYGPVTAAAFGYRIVNRACSGAVIDQIDAANPDNAREPRQIDAVRGLGPRDVVALSMGGNDLDWSGLVQNCLRYQELDHTVWAWDPDACQAQKNGGDALVATTLGRLAGTYGEVLDATKADVFVLTYPPIVPARSDDATKDCVLQNIGQFKNEHLSISADTSRRMVELERQFNQGIRDTVARIQQGRPDGARLHMVDVEAAFGGYEGHTISCGFGDRPEPWINTLRLDVPQLPLQLWKRVLEQQAYGKRTLHPTVAGQQAMARALMQGISDSR